MNILEKLTRFVNEVFKTTLDIFLEALQLSPNAQGYVSGSITELLLKKKLEEEYGFEVKRIKEKWEGRSIQIITAIFTLENRQMICGLCWNRKALNRIRRNGTAFIIMEI